MMTWIHNVIYLIKSSAYFTRIDTYIVTSDQDISLLYVDHFISQFQISPKIILLRGGPKVMLKENTVSMCKCRHVIS